MLGSVGAALNSDISVTRNELINNPDTLAAVDCGICATKNELLDNHGTLAAVASGIGVTRDELIINPGTAEHWKRGAKRLKRMSSEAQPSPSKASA